jgi:glutathione S-transferase
MVGVSRVAATDAPCRAPAPTRAYAYACGRECDRGPFVTTALRSARAALSATTMLLYDSPVSGNCYKVRLLFAHLGLSYERRECSVVDRSNRAEILGDLNPALRVPTLILDDGRPLAESHAIIWYFAEGSPYLPDERFERAKVLQWLCFEQYDLEPTIAVVRFWVAFSDSSDVPFLVGGRYTLADIALYGYTHVAHEGGFDLAGYPAIRGWLERVAAQPGHVTINA